MDTCAPCTCVYTASGYLVCPSASVHEGFTSGGGGGFDRVIPLLRAYVTNDELLAAAKEELGKCESSMVEVVSVSKAGDIWELEPLYAKAQSHFEAAVRTLQSSVGEDAVYAMRSAYTKLALHARDSIDAAMTYAAKRSFAKQVALASIRVKNASAAAESGDEETARRTATEASAICDLISQQPDAGSYALRECEAVHIAAAEILGALQRP